MTELIGTFKEEYEGAVDEQQKQRYTDAYSQPILQETCALIKNGIKTIIGTENVPEEIRKIVG